jgi:hypothetical protein
VEIHSSARKHGIGDEDIKHAAMKMRPKYRRLLPED